MKKLAFIGLGNMGRAICSGLIAGNAVAAADVRGYAPHWDRLAAYAEETGITPCRSALEAVEIREQILIVEGNWLLLDEAPWRDLRCDYSIFLRAGDERQLERIVQRKMMGGYGEEAARVFVRENDWPNIQRCMAHSRRGDLNLAPALDGTLEVI